MEITKEDLLISILNEGRLTVKEISGGKRTMVAYKLYWLDEARKEHLIGILPERRRDPKRITQESIMNWGRMVIGDDTDFKKLFFSQVIIDEDTGRIIKIVH